MPKWPKWPKWIKCGKCSSPDTVVCRGCNTVLPYCDEHIPSTYLRLGEHVYCGDVDRRCRRILYCTKCDINKIENRSCSKYKCTATNDLCDACGGSIKRVQTDANSFESLCAEHTENFQKPCTICSHPSFQSELTRCACCQKRGCVKCFPVQTIDISPISVYGSGLSYFKQSYLCTECVDGRSEKMIQNHYANSNEHLGCRKHSGFDFQATLYPFVVYCEHTGKDGKTTAKMELMKSDKRTTIELCDLSDIGPEEIEYWRSHGRLIAPWATRDQVKRYCEDHPEKHVKWDGFEYIFPSQ